MWQLDKAPSLKAGDSDQFIYRTFRLGCNGCGEDGRKIECSDEPFNLI
jgi:hypothetical protein